nr:hypothetical protein [Streptomyces sp. N35]
MRAAGGPIFEYYQDIKHAVGDDEDDFVSIAGPDDLWQHIQPGGEVWVGRAGPGDEGVYVSVECECAWDPEHGLQIVFRGGRSVSKVGQCDGHLTNASAYDDKTLAGVVYHRLG